MIGHLSDEVTGTIGYLDPIYMSSGMYTTMADAYAMGITMLVSFTGVDAVCAMRTCNEMLETPSRAFEYADARAEWSNDETCTRLAQIIQVMRTSDCLNDETCTRHAQIIQVMRTSDCLLVTSDYLLRTTDDLSSSHSLR